jgi:hypothetical protein
MKPCAVIWQAGETGALELDLSLIGLDLNRLPRESAGLTSLQSLNLFHCKQLSDLGLSGVTQQKRQLSVATGRS